MDEPKPAEIIPAYDTALLKYASDEFLRNLGHDPAAIRNRSDETARELLRAASLHASGLAAHVESKSRLVRNLNSGK